LEALVLGLVQGLTEFLPVSSSGHLVLAQHLLHVRDPEILSFDIFVHLGTIISLAVVLWKDFRDILAAVWEALSQFQFARSFRENLPFRTGVILAVGSIPAGVVGILFHQQIRNAFTDPKLVSMNFAVTGLMLFLTRLARPANEKKMGILGALAVGFGQAFAILPGISRTGVTMSIAMYLRMAPVKAARLSFLLAVPAIAGGAIVESRFYTAGGMTTGVLPILAGTAVAAVTGYLVIKMMLKITEKGKFSLFSFYCLAVGLFGIIFI
jgi:undecaprenyl-diphosphatase